MNINTQPVVFVAGLCSSDTDRARLILSSKGYHCVSPSSLGEIESSDYNAFCGSAVLAYLGELFDRYDNYKLIYVFTGYKEWMITATTRMWSDPVNNSFKLEVRSRLYGKQQPDWDDLRKAYLRYQQLFLDLDQILMLSESSDRWEEQINEFLA